MSSIFKGLIKDILLCIVVLVLVYFFSGVTGQLYRIIFGPAGSFIDTKALSGISLSYTFFLTLIFTAFGDRHKYWWIAVLLIPAAIFEIYFDLEHLYFPIALGLLGWLLGLGSRKLIYRSPTSI